MMCVRSRNLKEEREGSSYSRPRSCPVFLTPDKGSHSPWAFPMCES